MQTVKNIAAKLTGAKSGEVDLPAGSLILVTGASGYIGSHVVNEALEAGYKVRGTARTQEKADNTRKIFKNHPNYSTAIAADFSKDGAFDATAQGEVDVDFRPHLLDLVTDVEDVVKRAVLVVVLSPGDLRPLLEKPETLVTEALGIVHILRVFRVRRARKGAAHEPSLTDHVAGLVPPARVGSLH